jgi:hypothetical protein
MQLMDDRNVQIMQLMDGRNAQILELMEQDMVIAALLMVLRLLEMQ